MPTQVIHVPLSRPNAICHAGSRDWKNSSGWKKVWIVKALRRRKATRKQKTDEGEEGETEVMVLRWKEASKSNTGPEPYPVIIVYLAGCNKNDVNGKTP